MLRSNKFDFNHARPEMACHKKLSLSLSHAKIFMANTCINYDRLIHYFQHSRLRCNFFKQLTSIPVFTPINAKVLI